MSTPALVETDECFEIGRRRMDFAVDAICEIEALCELLRKVIPPESYPENPIVRGLSGRIESLANAAIAALVDRGDDIVLIARKVCIDLPKQEGDA